MTLPGGPKGHSSIFGILQQCCPHTTSTGKGFLQYVWAITMNISKTKVKIWGLMQIENCQ